MKNLRNKILSTLAAFFFAVTPSFATVDFLWDNSGTNGQITSTLTLLSTELNSLANAAVIISSVGGTSGTFTQGNTASAVWGIVTFNAGTAGATCAAGANIALWFLQSANNSTFESTTTAPARAPDAIVPLPASTLNATFIAQGLVQVPALPFKVLAQNNCGTSGTLAASGNTVTIALVAIHYN